MHILILSCISIAKTEFDRVDFISEDRGLWLNYEVAALGYYPTRGMIRWLNQVKGVWKVPLKNSYIGISVASQSVVYEQPIAFENMYLTAGIQSQLLLPNGFTLGAAWRDKGFRIGLGLSATSEATWSRVTYSYWSLLPTLGFGYGKNPIKSQRKH